MQIPKTTFFFPLLRPIVVFIIFLVVLGGAPSSASSGTSFIYNSCSDQKFDDGSPFESNIDSLLSSLLNSAAIYPYNHFTVNSPSPEPTLYGLYQCRGDISSASCASCVRDAVVQLPHYCYHSCGATVQLDACHVRYSNDSFVGLPDKTLVLKKCGSSATTSTTTDILSRRDEVLSELGTARNVGEGYRAGSAGYVSGMAQCLGDISGQDCTDCVSDAAEKLRGGCGAGVWGDVYLAKCYVRYSAAGVVSGCPGRFRLLRLELLPLLVLAFL